MAKTFQKKKLTPMKSKRLWVFTIWIVVIFFFTIIALNIIMGPQVPYSKLMEIEQIKQFIDENPNATINETYIGIEDSASVVEKVLEKCGIDVEEKNYVLVEISSGGKKVMAYYDPESQEIICTFTNDKTSPDGEEDTGGEDGGSDGGEGTTGLPCTSASECDDSNSYTTDTCSSGVCSNVLQSCSQIGGAICQQGYSCTSQPVSSSDGSCCLDSCEDAGQGTCQTDNDCDDSDVTTLDTCEGIPLACVNTLLTCSQIGYYSCSPSHVCNAGYVAASDTSMCCPEQCSTPIEEQCQSDGDCTSSTPLFVGTCNPASNYCTYTVSGCGEGDDDCPAGCTPETDSDCSEGE